MSLFYWNDSGATLCWLKSAVIGGHGAIRTMDGAEGVVLGASPAMRVGAGPGLAGGGMCVVLVSVRFGQIIGLCQGAGRACGAKRVCDLNMHVGLVAVVDGGLR